MGRRAGGQACETTGGRAGENTCGRSGCAAGERGRVRAGGRVSGWGVPSLRGIAWAGTSGTSAGASALGTQAPPMPALSCIDKGEGGQEAGTSLVHATGFNLGKSPMRSAMCMGTGRLAQV